MLPLEIDEVIRLSLLILLYISFNVYHFIPSIGINSPDTIIFSFLFRIYLIGCILFLESFNSFIFIKTFSLLVIAFSTSAIFTEKLSERKEIEIISFGLFFNVLILGENSIILIFTSINFFIQ